MSKDIIKQVYVCRLCRAKRREAIIFEKHKTRAKIDDSGIVQNDKSHFVEEDEKTICRQCKKELETVMVDACISETGMIVKILGDAK